VAALYALWGPPSSSDVPDLLPYRTLLESGTESFDWSPWAKASTLSFLRQSHTRDRQAELTAVDLAKQAHRRRRLWSSTGATIQHPPLKVRSFPYVTQRCRLLAFPFAMPGWLQILLVLGETVHSGRRQCDRSLVCGQTLPGLRSFAQTSSAVLARRAMGRARLRATRAPLPLELRRAALDVLAQDQRLRTSFID
jgi:hypothetical protein